MKPLGVAVIGADNWGRNLARNFPPTPAWTHFEVAPTCLETGKHILVEKPFAGRVAEGWKLVATAQRRQTVLTCDHTYMVASGLPEAEALAGVVRELAAAVHECREPLTGGTSGRWVLRILEAVPRSLAAAGAVVPLQSNGAARGVR